jgi:hypothetical protein
MARLVARGALAAALTTTAASIGCSAADPGPHPLGGTLAPNIDASVGVDSGRSSASPEVNTSDLCPVGLAPEDAGCPASLPVSGTCCTPLGILCDYPGTDGGDSLPVAHPYAECAPLVTPTGSVPVWSTGRVVERNACGAATDAGQSLDPGDAGTPCAERPTVPCNPVSPHTQQDALNAELESLVQSCGAPPCLGSVQVDFEEGCATDIRVSLAGPPAPSSFTQCLSEALASSHHACADGLSCAMTDGSECPNP